MLFLRSFFFCSFLLFHPSRTEKANNNLDEVEGREEYSKAKSTDKTARCEDGGVIKTKTEREFFTWRTGRWGNSVTSWGEGRDGIYNSLRELDLPSWLPIYFLTHPHSSINPSPKVTKLPCRRNLLTHPTHQSRGSKRMLEPGSV